MMCSYCLSSLHHLHFLNFWVSAEGHIGCSESPETLGTHWPVADEEVVARCSRELPDILRSLESPR